MKRVMFVCKKNTVLLCGQAGYLPDRYSERKETAAKQSLEITH